MSMDGVSSEELTSRAKQVVTRLDQLMKDIGPMITEIAQLRNEADLIVKELVDRGEIKRDELHPALQREVPPT